ncbi:MAG: YggT family protein [Sulfuricaulis sp.]
MNSFFTDAAALIVQVVFSLYILTLLLRFLFQLSRADFYNPVSQFLVALTNPLLRPLRRIIPGLYGIDIASIVLLFVLQALEVFLISQLNNYMPDALPLFIATVADLLRLTINVYFYAILLRVILSWFMPYGMRDNPAGDLLVSLTEPLLRRARRLVPAMGGIDLSPIVVLVGLQLLQLAFAHLLL